MYLWHQGIPGKLSPTKLFVFSSFSFSVYREEVFHFLCILVHISKEEKDKGEDLGEYFKKLFFQENLSSVSVKG